MGFLDKLLGRKQADPQPERTVVNHEEQVVVNHEEQKTPHPAAKEEPNADTI